MKRNFLTIATLAAVGALVALPVFADTDNLAASDSNNLVANKLSLTLGAGGSKFHINSSDLSANAVDTNAVSYKLAAEYKVLKHLGVELAYDNFGKTNVDLGFTTTDIKNDAVSLSLVGRFSVLDNLDLFAKAGYARTEARFFGATSKHNSWVLGLGGEYKFTKNISGVAEFDQFNSFADSGKKMDSLTAGVKYNF